MPRARRPGADLRTATTRRVAARSWQGRLRRRPDTPLWPFGFGRSYTTLRARSTCGSTPRRCDDDGDAVTRQRRRRQHRTAAGDEVVQLYVRDEEATVARPVLELRGFRRVTARSPASAGRSRSACPPSSSPTSAPTSDGSSSPAASVCGRQLLRRPATDRRGRARRCRRRGGRPERLPGRGRASTSRPAGPAAAIVRCREPVAECRGIHFAP